MGYMQQESATQPDSNKIIFSTWVRMPQETVDGLGIVPVFQWGDISIGNPELDTFASALRINPFVSTEGAQIYLGSRPHTPRYRAGNSTAVRMNFLGVSVQHPGGEAGAAFYGNTLWRGAFTFNSAIEFGDAVTNQTTQEPFKTFRDDWFAYQAGGGLKNWGATVTVLNPALPPEAHEFTGLQKFAGQFNTPDIWNHICFSADTSISAIVTPVPSAQPVLTQAHKLYIAVNEVDVSPTQVSINSQPIDAGRGDILPLRGHKTGSTVSPGWVEIYWGGDQPDDPPAVVDAWDIAVAGDPVGVPAPAYRNDSIGKIEMAYTQVFFGNAVDVGNSNVRRKFTRLEALPGGGTRVRPARTFPATGLGTPAYAFRGGQAQFHLNRGSRGNMVTSGTKTDFEPGP